MLNTRIFSDKLKGTKTISNHKKDDETLFTRHISLLPAISKIFENVIFKQLYHFLSR